MSRIGGLGSFLLAAIWSYGWEAFRSFLYGEGFTAMSSVETETMLHWGVPLLLVIVGLLLFIKAGNEGLPDWSLTLPSSQIPLHVAARQIYEAAEKAGVLDLTLSSSSPPEAKLSHFKILIMLETEIFGVKPPSTQSMPIPKSELRGELFPVDGNVSEIGHIASPGPNSTYINVTVRRHDVKRLIKKYLTEYVEEAKLLRAGKWPR